MWRRKSVEQRRRRQNWQLSRRRKSPRCAATLWACTTNQRSPHCRQVGKATVPFNVGGTTCNSVGVIRTRACSAHDLDNKTFFDTFALPLVPPLSPHVQRSTSESTATSDKRAFLQEHKSPGTRSSARTSFQVQMGGNQAPALQPGSRTQSRQPQCGRNNSASVLSSSLTSPFRRHKAKCMHRLAVTSGRCKLLEQHVEAASRR